MLCRAPGNIQPRAFPRPASAHFSPASNGSNRMISRCGQSSYWDVIRDREQHMGNYEIAVLVGWVIAVWALCSVLFSGAAKFENLGRSKRRWFLIELTAFIPYVGFIAV